ncbi:hypothetical protein BA915_06015 [Helicobacter pullorum]|nr:hypothetical protein HPU229313_06185 [Helicobacter pullorum]OCR10167.1 hypothetical protein A7X13_03070 [Helicobacter pullorum]OCR15060.1 hypothetical protein BA915_06015 [Helicobacter pullorum]
MKVYLAKETSRNQISSITRNLRNQSLALLIPSLSCKRIFSIKLIFYKNFKRIKSHLFNSTN